MSDTKIISLRSSAPKDAPIIMMTKNNKVTDRISVSDLVRKLGEKFRNIEWYRFEGNKLREVRVFFGAETKSADTEKMSEAAIIKLIDDRLKAVHDKDINAFLPEHTPDILAFDVIAPPPYIGADLAIARDMDNIITFASPRKT